MHIRVLEPDERVDQLWLTDLRRFSICQFPIVIS